MKGILEDKGNIKIISEGKNQKGKPWTLWGTLLTIDGKRYGLSEFSKTKLSEILEPLNEGDEVEFGVEEREKNGVIYLDIKDKKLDKVSDSPTESVSSMSEKPSKEYWEARDYRISKLAALKCSLLHSKTVSSVNGKLEDWEDIKSRAKLFLQDFIYE